jgi:uncharacterized protein with FMN-binding domain
MRNHVVVPLVLLATLSTLASCTKPVSETVVTPVTTPPVKVEVVTPAPVAPAPVTPAPTETATGTPVTAAPQVLTRKETVGYKSPGGDDTIEFDVTVTDGVITSASATALALSDGSKYNQGNFVKALSAAVVGKKAKDLDVDAIGGASLTTAAFETFVRSF